MALTDLSRAPTDRRARNESGPRLFERSEFLREFEAIFSRTLQVPSRCIAIEGPWGSGRTALINAACESARQSGCLVLRARGGDAEKQIPFAVLGKLIESAGALAAGSGAVSDQADAITAHLGSGSGPRRDPVDISPRFHALLVALRAIGPVLVAVDDADLADRETLAVLEYVVRRLEDQQIWLLVSARPLHPGVGLRPVDGILTESGTRQFMLEPLGFESVGMMLAGFFGEEADPAFVAACLEATGGAPLLLKALLPRLARLQVHPVADQSGRVERVPVPKITQLVLGRLAQLPVAASDLLQASAVLGDGAEPTTAYLVAKIDALAGERAADAASHMELLRPGRPFAFSTPLIRWAVYHDIPTARRSHLHARAAQLLAEHGARDVTIAEHLLATEPVGDPETAVRLQQMGNAAVAAGDPELALRCLHRALAESSPASRAGSLYLDLASVELAQGRPSALTHFRQAVQLGVEDDAEVIRVALGLLRHLEATPQVRAEVLEAVQGLTDRLDDVDRNLCIEFELALAVGTRRSAGQRGDLDRLRALLGHEEEGCTSGPESDWVPTARAFVSVQDAAEGSSVSADTLSSILLPVVDAGRLSDPDPIVAAFQAMAVFGLLCVDRFDMVDELLRTALRHARERGTVAAEQQASVLLGTSLLWQGSLTAAEEEFRRGRTLGAGQRGHATLGLVDALLRQGKTDDVARYAQELGLEEIDAPTLAPLVRIERGRLLVADGRLREGLDEFMVAGNESLEAGIVNPAASPWRADAAMVLSTLGEWPEAGRLATEHLQLARRFGAVRSIGIGLRAAAAATPDLIERTTLLAEAVDLLEPSPARLEASYALVELGMVLVERMKKEEARSVLRRGANLASLCGAHQLVESAGTQLRAAGARPRRLGQVGLESLTPAELRVARLAASGMTNQGIATDLYVSVKTVEGHLVKTYRKLGVDSRRGLTRVLGSDDGECGSLLDAS